MHFFLSSSSCFLRFACSSGICRFPRSNLFRSNEKCDVSIFSVQSSFFFLKKSFLLKKWLLLLMSHFLNKFQTISKICESLEKSAPKITCSLLVNKSFHKSSSIFNFIKKKENFHLFFLIIHKWWFEKLSNLRETCSKNHLSRSIRASSQVARLACVSSTS